jgi:uncharacterized protein (UPF0332 family)
MITDENSNELITYRIDQAKSTAMEAEALLQKSMFRGSMNRIYYSMFYMLQALSLRYKFESSKHSQLLSWFNKTFIHSGKISVKYSKNLTKGYNLRTKGDYATVYTLEKEEVEGMFEEMKEFLQEIEHFLKMK